MAVMNVNPTRMEMKRLQQRLKTATRGHKLLKDKTDEMIRRFITLAEENIRLRRETEKDLAKALSSFTLAPGSEDAGGGGFRHFPRAGADCGRHVPGGVPGGRPAPVFWRRQNRSDQ